MISCTETGLCIISDFRNPVEVQNFQFAKSGYEKWVTQNDVTLELLTQKVLQEFFFRATSSAS